VARWGVECGRDTVGSGDAARWGVETVERRRNTMGVECRRGVVGSGDGGVQRDSMGIGERSAVGALAR
jgi:hypothetical protein